MISRIADSVRFGAMAENVANLQGGMSRASEQLSTQKKINQPADDPAGAKAVLNLRTAGAAIDQYQANIAGAQTRLKATELTLTSINDLLKQAQGVAQTAAGTSAPSRSDTADLLQSISDQVRSLANTQLDGRHLFSGAMTGTQPFPDSTSGYQGDRQTPLINIGSNQSAASNITGDAVFTFPAAGGGVDDIFKSLDSLIETLRDPAANSTDVSQALASFNDTSSQVQGQVQENIIKTDAMTGNFEFANNHLTYLKDRIGSMISKTEDADVAKLAMEFQMHALALNASYTVASKMNEGSILNLLQ